MAAYPTSLTMAKEGYQSANHRGYSVHYGSIVEPDSAERQKPAHDRSQRRVFKLHRSEAQRAGGSDAYW